MDELLYPIRLQLGPCNGLVVDVDAGTWQAGAVVVSNPHNRFRCRYERAPGTDRWLHERTY